MDNSKNLSSDEIQDMINSLDIVFESMSNLNETDTLTISNKYDQISLNDYNTQWDYNNGFSLPSLQPLTTSQLASIMPSYGINTALPSTLTSTNSNSIFQINNNQGYSTIGSITPSLSVKGKADFEDDITLNGKSLTKILDGIEQRLAILHPNEKLEDRWQELKDLGQRYRELEAEIISREEMFKTLKD